MARRNILGAGAVVPATAPRRMVEGEHFTVTYDAEASSLEFNILQEPPSATTVTSYVATFGVERDEDVLIPLGGPFPYIVPFTPATHPKTWEGHVGQPSWQLSARVAAVNDAGTIGRYSTSEPVSIVTGDVVPEVDWSVAEIRDSGTAGGVEGKLNVSVGEVDVPSGYQLRIAAKELPYVEENWPEFHDLGSSVAATIDGDTVIATGLAPPAIVRVVLLWYVIESAQWFQASDGVETIELQGLINVALPSLVTAPVITGPVAGKAYIGQQITGTAGDWNGETSVSRQYAYGIGPIEGATSLNYTPTADGDQRRIRLRETATNAGGSIEAVSNILDVVYAPPSTVGSILNITIDQEDGAVAVHDWSGKFSGENLGYSVAGHPAVTIDAAGVGQIARSNVIPATQITVTAQNSGGSVQQQFILTVEEQAATITWPALVQAGHWTVTEVRDTAEATAQGFGGESGHLKAVWSGSIVHGNPDFKLRHMLLGGATAPTPTTALPEVVPGATYYTEGQLAVGATARPRLFREHVATGTFKADAVKSPFVIQGLITGGGDLNASTIAQIESAMASADPGETIVVAAGSYGTGTITRSGLSKAAPGVTLRAAVASNRPRFTGQGLDLTNCNGFTFDGFHFGRTSTSGGVPTGSVLRIEGCDRFTLRNCTVTGGQTQCTFPGDPTDVTIEWCEFGGASHDNINFFAGVQNLTIRNNRFWNPQSPLDRLHNDFIQFLTGSAGDVNNVDINDNYFESDRAVWHGVFFGYPGAFDGGFVNVTVLRNWLRMGDYNGLRFHGVNNLDCRLNRLQDFPGRNRNNIRLDGRRVTGVIADNVTPRPIVRSGNDQTTGGGNVVSASATPPGWNGFDVANNRFGPYAQ